MFTEILNHSSSRNLYILTLFDLSIDKGNKTLAKTIITRTNLKEQFWFHAFIIALEKNFVDLCVNICENLELSNVLTCFYQACKANHKDVITALCNKIATPDLGNYLEKAIWEDNAFAIEKIIKLGLSRNHMGNRDKFISAFKQAKKVHTLNLIMEIIQSTSNSDDVPVVDQFGDEEPFSKVLKEIKPTLVNGAIRANDINLYRRWSKLNGEVLGLLLDMDNKTSLEMVQELSKDPELFKHADSWLAGAFNLRHASDPRVAEIIKFIVNHPQFECLEYSSNWYWVRLASEVFSENYNGPRLSLEEGIKTAQELKDLEKRHNFRFSGCDSGILKKACKTKSVTIVKTVLKRDSAASLPKLTKALQYATNHGLQEIADIIQEKISSKSTLKARLWKLVGY